MPTDTRPDPVNPRPEGYYWVQVDGRLTVAQWDGRWERWTVCGNDETWPDDPSWTVLSPIEKP